MKYLGIPLVKDLYTKHYKMLLKEIKEHLSLGRNGKRKRKPSHKWRPICKSKTKSSKQKNLRYSGHSLKDSENFGSQDSEHTDWKLIIY